MLHTFSMLITRTFYKNKKNKKKIKSQAHSQANFKSKTVSVAQMHDCHSHSLQVDEAGI